MVLEKVIDMITELNGAERDTVTPEVLLTELSLDSLDIAELILNIEDEFKISITERETLKSVGDVVAYIEKNK
jgi:Phosphopantetheine attachment site.